MKFELCKKIVATITRPDLGFGLGLGLALRIGPTPPRSGFRLNIPNIRSVTKNPPTILIVPNAIAITNNTCSRTPRASCINNSPPSNTIP